MLSQSRSYVVDTIDKAASVSFVRSTTSSYSIADTVGLGSCALRINTSSFMLTCYAIYPRLLQAAAVVIPRTLVLQSPTIVISVLGARLRLSSPEPWPVSRRSAYFPSIIFPDLTRNAYSIADWVNVRSPHGFYPSK